MLVITLKILPMNSTCTGYLIFQRLSDRYFKIFKLISIIFICLGVKND